MKLSELFQKCLTIPYEETRVSANYASERRGTALHLYFEGSSGLDDWKRNLSFPAKPYRRMEETVWLAHGGFLAVWREIEPMLSDRIADPQIKSIVISGYSHGAAVAVLCHEYVWFHRPDLRGRLTGYGFGCPRVLFGLPLPHLRERWERFTVIRNIDDLVTHLPPAILGYRHVGRMLEIGQSGKYSPTEAHYPENIRKELEIYERGAGISLPG